jgi:hypothetical protein
MRDDEDPFPPVPRADATSRKYNRLHFVACGFQVKAHVIECHADESRNIFPTHEARTEFFNKSQHLRPEMTTVVFSPLLSGDGKRLAWKTPGKQVCTAPLSAVEGSDVVMDRHSRPVFRQNLLAIRIALTKYSCPKARPFPGQRKSPNS